MSPAERPMREMDRDIAGSIIVINNAIFDGEREDTAGPLALRLLEENRVHVNRTHAGETRSFLKYARENHSAVVAAINEALNEGSRFLLTIGGTGISAGDVAPEATAPFLDVAMDGIAQEIRQHGLTQTPLASLSRGLVGITHRGKGGTLIVNAPGSRGGVKDSLAVVCKLLPHIFEQLDDQD